MSFILESHLTSEQAREELARDVRAGLTAAPKRLRSWGSTVHGAASCPTDHGAAGVPPGPRGEVVAPPVCR